MSQQSMYAVHPPLPQNCRGWVHFFRIGVWCSPKNVLKGKPVLFGVIQVKRTLFSACSLKPNFDKLINF